MENKKWFKYLGVYRGDILEWVKEFVPHRYELLMTLMNSGDIDRFKLERLLNEIWFEAPDALYIRTSGFTRLTDLLDGGFEFRS